MNHPTESVPVHQPVDEAAPAYATAGDLTAPAPTSKEEDFELPSGLWVRIRPLMRSVVLAVNKLEGLALDQKEQKYLANAMVLPRMSEADIRKWQTNSVAGDIEGLMNRVQQISGLGEKGAKAAAKAFPEPGE